MINPETKARLKFHLGLDIEKAKFHLGELMNRRDKRLAEVECMSDMISDATYRLNELEEQYERNFWEEKDVPYEDAR